MKKKDTPSFPKKTFLPRSNFEGKTSRFSFREGYWEGVAEAAAFADEGLRKNLRTDWGKRALLFTGPGKMNKER